MTISIRIAAALYTATVFVAIVANAWAAEPAARSSDDKRPTIYLIGDSTVNNGTKGLQGWGTPFTTFFDAKSVRVENRARGGRSSRTYLAEGWWSKVESQLRPGDFVLMQFGHNDGGAIDKPPYRASIKGTGDDTKDWTDPKTGKHESVHSYGWYLRQYIAGAQNKGAVAIVLSPVPRNIWRDGKVARASGDYGRWAAESATASKALFIDLNEIIARRYEREGQSHVENDYFTAADHTHTVPLGAKTNAQCVVDGIRGLKDCKLSDYFLSASK